MAKRIVTGDLLLRNDLLIIAQIIEHSLDYYHNHHSLFVSEYLQELRTLIGLGFTAVLADGNLLHLCQPHLAYFLAAQKDFKINQKAKQRMAQISAELVHIATLCFYRLKFPPYYTNFIALLRQTLTHIPKPGWENEVERLLNHLSAQ